MLENSAVWFIVNFHSGTLSSDKKQSIIGEIKKYSQSKIFITKYANHAKILTQNAISQGIKRVVAVGGDGTINEIASVLRGTELQLGIIPIGSGNGLARHLKIPLIPILAIKKAMTGHEFLIDTCTINEIPFFCTAGVGFDAQVAHDFAKKKTRGFLTYILTSIQVFFKYNSADYLVDFSGNRLIKNAFAITFANASQYGNDAVVAPESKIDDGLIDTVILQPFSVFSSIFIAFRLFNHSFSKSKFVETLKLTELKVIGNQNLIIHYDGEPKLLVTNELDVKISEKKLKVIV